MSISELENKTMLELYQIARDLGLSGYSKLRKKELIFEITKALTKADELLQAQGVLEIMNDGYGFLRPFSYLPSQ
ncbi:MAG: Rho termination factor N-terminal domain-containing protein, partial [Syntrophomonadaceae bacterium]|nr:Rho termination factor N-terminal domain-containing protein [Syntrophomonadaceae bacterium]